MFFSNFVAGPAVWVCRLVLCVPSFPMIFLSVSHSILNGFLIFHVVCFPSCYSYVLAILSVIIPLCYFLWILCQAGKNEETNRRQLGLKIGKHRVPARRSGKIRKRMGSGKKAGLKSNLFFVRPPAGLRTSFAPSMTWELACSR